MEQEISVFWFRRDLRWRDNHGLYQALNRNYPVIPIFIFDKNILDSLPKDDARVTFIHRKLKRMVEETSGKTFEVLHGTPIECWKKITGNYAVKAVYTNHDYEPYAKEREKEVTAFLSSKGISFHTFKDQVIFEKDEVLTNNDKPYTVFTPYKNKWLEKFRQQEVNTFPSEKKLNQLLPGKPNFPTLAEIGFETSKTTFPGKTISTSLIQQYAKLRDFPAEDATSRLGVHLRFGTISIRELVKETASESDVYLNELIWREFYQAILYHYPKVVNNAFKSDYDNIPWINDEEAFQKWCNGQTGYPMVDAGMRQLNETGYMHNRVRMVTASFLTKHLLQDWRKGEAYFAEKLLDFELASNNGGWQWAAGSGCDAAPYFRIFNPETQLKKFDPDLKYVKKWILEFGTSAYPKPMIDHKWARNRTLEVYKKALG